MGRKNQYWEKDNFRFFSEGRKTIGEIKNRQEGQLRREVDFVLMDKQLRKELKEVWDA